jgi:outer membrane immunogenic protein
MLRVFGGAIVIVSGAVATTAPAIGADLKAVPVVAGTPWTGLYAGLSVGSRWTQADWSTTALNSPIFGALPPGSDFAASFGHAAFRLGGFLGVNYQIGRWVVGVEGDVGDAFDAKKTIVGIPGTNIDGTFPLPNLDRTSVETRWDASIRARAGYLVAPNVLLYGTGGIAFQGVTETLVCSAFPNTPVGGCAGPATESFNKTLTTWTAGGGIEAMFAGNWLARVDYRFADFGSLDHIFSQAQTTSGPIATSTRFNTHTVTFGLGYKFGDGIGPDPAYAAEAAMVRKAPPLAVASWTGPYLGLSVGARRSNPVWTTTEIFGPGGAPSPGNVAAFDVTAFRFGGYAGYNYQIARAVFGVEGDLAGVSRSEKSFMGFPGTLSSLFPDDPDRSSVKTGWDGSIRGRAGFLIAPNVLIYGTAGVAFQQVEVAASCVDVTAPVPGLFCGGGNHAESVSKVLTAATFGGGIEAMFARNWLARADYRYADFGTINHAFFTNAPFDLLNTSTKLQTHTFALGLAYKLEPGAM